MSKGTILLAAGGTGGHLFPAEALAHELIERGFDVELATDKRAEKFAANFPSDKIHVIESATVRGKSPLALFKMCKSLLSGFRASRKILIASRPKAVVGFGGYPTLPPLFASTWMKIPSLVHEQNAVLGRANKLLANWVNGIAIGFTLVGDKPKIPIVETGNPVRPLVDVVRNEEYPFRQPNEKFRLVVFGGSQGARFFSEVMPAALALLPKKYLERLSLVQQVRPEDKDQLSIGLDKFDIEVTLSSFFENMPAEIANAHFVIARAGASSVTELAVIGRPSILVPLPGSLDGDQANNAITMQNAGGAFVIAQPELSPQKLADHLINAMDDPEVLRKMGRSAKKTGIVNASSRLADCVECVIAGRSLTQL